MKTKRGWAGIDVSKDELSLALWPQGKTWTCPRSEEALQRLAEELCGLRVRLVVLEAHGRIGAAGGAGAAPRLRGEGNCTLLPPLL